MKRHYTTTDLNMLRNLARPGWHDVVLDGLTHRSLGRLVTDNLVELQIIDNFLQVRRLDWPASLSRILAA